MEFKHFIAAGALILCACATGPVAYGPATGSGYGFQTEQIERDRFVVRFTARDEVEARNFALLRAAEVTLDHNQSKFRVVGGQTLGDGDTRAPISTSIGVGIGNGGYYGRGTRTNVGVGIGIYDVARALNGNRVTASLEILFGDGGRADAPNVYDARSVLQSLRPRAQLN